MSRRPFFVCECGHAWLNHGKNGCGHCKCDEVRDSSLNHEKEG